MRALIEKSTGQTLGLWPDDVIPSVRLFDAALHEWDNNAPNDLIMEDAHLYVKVGNQYVRS